MVIIHVLNLKDDAFALMLTRQVGAIRLVSGVAVCSASAGNIPELNCAVGIGLWWIRGRKTKAWTF